MSIEVLGVAKRFGDFTALHEVDLKVETGELVALLGPSGSGKTTLLRVIAGLEQPDAGDVLFDGASAVARGARDRGVGFVFQHYALFRHMTVFDNVAFGLRVRPRGERPGAAEIRSRVAALLRLVQIDRLAARYPAELSGGQRQRVALARALAIEPKVLLLDEPFGALDAQVRKDLRRWLRRLHDEMHMTSVFVTHDQEEALELADRVAVMGQGRVEQIDTPDAIYDRPANPFVYQFLGNVNRLPCVVVGDRVELSGIFVDRLDRPPNGEGDAVLFVRPSEIDLLPGSAGLDGDAVVRFVAFTGPTVRLEVAPANGGPLIEVEVPKQAYRALDLRVGSRVFLRARRAALFPPMP
ncbi:MAG TPA: sulfate ABC transporter ATP-binding protein [Alphaproteobacteria bacterium]|jgi:sulfate transport system ATP-binding protein|nr:sulfate ABC transporter ATP-binding protein [Alphaproteobacteria bacterium]